jgi:hypothetical protein
MESTVNADVLGFGEYNSLKSNFNFKLSIGDIVRLNHKVCGYDSRSHWTIGLYKVTAIRLGAAHRSNAHDARFYSYWFDKIKKDSSKANNNFYGWNCHSFDVDFLETNLAEKL